jgi:hypothetical protein
MNDAQFFIDNQEMIESIKKQAKTKALNTFAVIAFFAATIFNGFYALLALLPFILLWSFGIYSNTKQRLLHEQFPDKFDAPKPNTNTCDYSHHKIIDPSNDIYHPLNPSSPNYWGKRRN